MVTTIPIRSPSQNCRTLDDELGGRQRTGRDQCRRTLSAMSPVATALATINIAASRSVTSRTSRPSRRRAAASAVYPRASTKETAIRIGTGAGPPRTTNSASSAATNNQSPLPQPEGEQERQRQPGWWIPRRDPEPADRVDEAHPVEKPDRQRRSRGRARAATTDARRQQAQHASGRRRPEPCGDCRAKSAACGATCRRCVRRATRAVVLGGRVEGYCNSPAAGRVAVGHVFGTCRGSTTANSVPSASDDRSVMSPPWAAAICFAM